MKLGDYFSVDESLEEEGVWIPMGPGAQIRVARFGNPKHRKVLERLRRPYRSILSSGNSLPDDVEENIAIVSMAEAVLVGWEGIEDEQGQPLEYNQGNAKRVLSEYKEFREFVARIALEAEHFRQEATEEISGNSSDS